MIVDEAEYQHRASLNLGAENDIANFMPVLRSKVSNLGPGGRVVELGVRAGNSTVALLMGLQNGGHLWSIDIDPKPDLEHPDWSFLQADDMSQQAMKWVPRWIDILFIDSSHAFDHTLGELTAYGVRVKKGGCILLHDTDLSARALSWLGLPVDPEFPVRAALDTWTAAQGLTWDNHTGGYGLGVVNV